MSTQPDPVADPIGFAKWDERRLAPRERLQRTGIRDEFFDLELELVDAPVRLRTTYAAVREWTALFERNWRDGKGWTLCGPASLGKTYLASLAGVELSRKWGFVVRLARVNSLISREQRIRDLRPLVDRWDDSAINEYGDLLFQQRMLTEGIHLLIADDMGKEHRTSSGYVASYLENLIRERFQAGLPTVITTNKDPDQLTETYSFEFSEFLHEACPFLPLSGQPTHGDSLRIKEWKR